MELEVLRKDMVAAMKAKDKVTKEAVSSLISAVKKVAISSCNPECDLQCYRRTYHTCSCPS